MSGKVAAIFLLVLATCMSGLVSGAAKPQPPPDQVVVVIMSTLGYSDVIGNEKAPYINSLKARGALFTESHGMDAQADQPNYLYLFAGTASRVNSDVYPPASAPFSFANLHSALVAANRTFCSYSESLPSVGYTGAASGLYYPPHNPVSLFANVPAEANRPLLFEFSGFDFAQLPTVSFVVPNLQNDMKNGTVEQADRWLRTVMSNYIDYAASSRSLFVLTWDAQRGVQANRVPTMFIGGIVKPGQVVSHPINHLSVLQTITRMYSLPSLGASESASQMPDSIWQPPYVLPPLEPGTPTDPNPPPSNGLGGLAIFIIIVFSLAGALLAGFFAVFFYRKWRDSRAVIEVIDEDPNKPTPTAV